MGCLHLKIDKGVTTPDVPDKFNDKTKESYTLTIADSKGKSIAGGLPAQKRKRS